MLYILLQCNSTCFLPVAQLVLSNQREVLSMIPPYSNVARFL